ADPQAGARADALDPQAAHPPDVPGVLHLPPGAQRQVPHSQPSALDQAGGLLVRPAVPLDEDALRQLHKRGQRLGAEIADCFPDHPRPDPGLQLIPAPLEGVLEFQPQLRPQTAQVDGSGALPRLLALAADLVQIRAASGPPPAVMAAAQLPVLGPQLADADLAGWADSVALSGCLNGRPRRYLRVSRPFPGSMMAGA